MDVILRGRLIGQDRDGYLSLNDMWRVAEAPEWKSPRKWRTFPTTGELIAALEQNVRFSDVIRKTSTKSALYAKIGKGGGTFAHHILALAYAEYLNPRLAVEVRDIALRFWAGDLSLLDEFRGKQRVQAKEDERRVFFRDELAARNKAVDAELRKTGADERWQFREFHNAGYRGLYDGRDEDDIHDLKELKKSEKILDYMSAAEAAANWFRITQAEERIRAILDLTLDQACDVHHHMGQRTRVAIEDMGGAMPEDMPVPEHLRRAKRRLAARRKKLK